MQKHLERFLRSSDIPPYAWNIAIILAAVTVGLILKLLFSIFLKSQSQHNNGFSFFRSLVRWLNKPLSYFIPLFLFNLALPALSMPLAVGTQLDKMVEIALIITFAWLLINSVRVGEDYVLHRYNFQKENNLLERKVRTQLHFIKQFAISCIVFLAIAAIFMSFSKLRTIGAGLLTGVGVGGIIIGFAAQKSLGNFLAGLQIAFTQPIRIDDVLIVEGEWGKVEEITLTYVVIKIWDERRLILPINYFIEKPFQNWTRTSAQLLGTVFIYTDYSVPVDAIRSEIVRLVSKSKLWDGKVCTLVVTDLRESTVELRALMSAANSGHAFDLRCEVREQIMKFIADNYPGSLPKTRAELEQPKQG